MFIQNKALQSSLLSSLVLPMFCALVSGAAVATESTPVPLVTPATRPSAYREPYCGLYSIYTAAKFLGKEFDFGRLVQRKYLGSAQGSSVSELILAAEDLQIHTSAMMNLTVDELRLIKTPVILQVKADSAQAGYSHFVVYLGDDAGSALIYDSAASFEKVPYTKIRSVWGGSALITSDGPIDTDSIISAARVTYAETTLLAAGFAVGLYVLGRCWPSPVGRLQLARRSWIQCAVLVLTSSGVGISHHLFSEGGFLSGSGSTGDVERAYSTTLIPKVNQEAVRNLLKSDAIIIDARLPQDFESGHIEGAMNIPVTTRRSDIRALLSNVKKTTRIIIYCQSSTCLFSDQLARALDSEGFVNISIYSGGWDDWAATLRSS